MPIGRPTADRLREAQRIIDAQFTPEPPDVVNVENALHFVESEILEYRGRKYPVEPISGVDGLRLIQLGQELEALAKSAEHGPRALGAFIHCYNRLVREIGRLARPTGFWRGVLWRLRPNPFRRATYEEVRSILGFFGRCQTTSSVRYRGQVGSRRPSISRN